MDANARVRQFNIQFSRMELRTVLQTARERFGKAVVKSAWIYKYPAGRWEFQIPACDTFPSGYYWYGQAHNAYDARAKGWYYAGRDWDARQENK